MVADQTANADVLLVSTLPYSPNTVRVIQNQICGELRRLNETLSLRNRFTDTFARIVCALIGHTGWHSNRVWPSEETLAEEAKCDTATVKRCKRWLRKYGFLRVISDREELMRGPGEHWFVAQGRKKRGRSAVDHYDLSAFLPLLEGIRDVLAWFAGAPATTGAEEATTSTSPRRRALPEQPVPALISEEEYASLYPDPFAESPASPLPASPPVAAEPAVASHPDVSVKTTKFTPSMSNVGQTNKRDAAEKPAPRGVPDSPFLGAEAPRINKEQTTVLSDHTRRDLAAQKAMVLRLYRNGRGLFPKVGYKVLRTMGMEWCRALAIYIEGEELRTGQTFGGGYYHEVWRAWQAGKGDWPDWVRGEVAHENREQQWRDSAPPPKPERNNDKMLARPKREEPIDAEALIAALSPGDRERITAAATEKVDEFRREGMGDTMARRLLDSHIRSIVIIEEKERRRAAREGGGGPSD